MDQPRIMSGNHTAWLATSESGKQWIDITAAELPIEDVISMFQRHAEIKEPFYVQNVSVGGPFRLRRRMYQPQYLQWYCNDGRKFHSDGRTTV
jgi:hypothetical protein